MTERRYIQDWTDYIYEYLEEKYPGMWLKWETLPKGLMYIVTELAEAMEAWRDDDMEKAYEEFADIAIRVFHTARAIGCDLDHEMERKMKKNMKRPVHHGRVNI